MKKEEQKYLNSDINERIVKNINILLEANGINLYQFRKALRENEEYTLSYPYLNKIMNHPKENSMPLVYLMQCCDFLGIPLDTLVNSTLTPDKCIINSNSKLEKLIDTSKVIKKYKQNMIDKEKTTLNEERTLSMDDKTPQDSLFVTNPNNKLFSSVMQMYYCYFYPTVSSENKTIDSMLKGTLSFEPNGEECKVVLKIDTKKEKNNNVVYKTYEGTAVISSTVHNVHCTLRSEEIGEYCYIIFRHFHLNYALQDCHMASVLSTSSAGSSRKRYPTVLRMFLSREEISTEDLKFLAPHLWLNYSQITISEEGLLALKEVSSDYSGIVEDLFNKAAQEYMFLFKEKDVVSLAKNYLGDTEVNRFLTELRLQSYAYRYNKVSDTVESSVRELLISLGYYKNNT